MQEVNVFNLLKESSADVVISAMLACAFSIFYKKSHKLSSKIFFIISFLLGALCCLFLNFFLNSFTLTFDALKNAVSSGTLAVTVTAFVKNFAFLDGDDVKKALEKLLSSIIISDNLDLIVDEIIEKLKFGDQEINKEKLKELLKENGFKENDESLDAVCNFILNALKGEDDKT